MGAVEEAMAEAEKHGGRSSELLAALVEEARVTIEQARVLQAERAKAVVEEAKAALLPMCPVSREPIQQTIKWRKNEGDYKLASRLRLRVFVDVGCPVAGMTWLALEACVWRRGRGFSRAPPR